MGKATWDANRKDVSFLEPLHIATYLPVLSCNAIHEFGFWSFAPNFKSANFATYPLQYLKKSYFTRRIIDLGQIPLLIHS